MAVNDDRCPCLQFSDQIRRQSVGEKIQLAPAEDYFTGSKLRPHDSAIRIPLCIHLDFFQDRHIFFPFRCSCDVQHASLGLNVRKQPLTIWVHRFSRHMMRRDHPKARGMGHLCRRFLLFSCEHDLNNYIRLSFQSLPFMTIFPFVRCHLWAIAFSGKNQSFLHLPSAETQVKNWKGSYGYSIMEVSMAHYSVGCR